MTDTQVAILLVSIYFILAVIGMIWRLRQIKKPYDSSKTLGTITSVEQDEFGLSVQGQLNDDGMKFLGWETYKKQDEEE